MKIPLVYPKIPNNTNCPLKKCIAFEKYDGTNLHWVWHSRNGWVEFGTRRDRFSLSENGIKEFTEAHPELQEASILLLDPHGTLDEFLFSKYSECKEVVVFTEFLGPHSFAGTHDPHDEKQLVIFDIMADGQLLSPETFIKEFKYFNIAKVIYQGKYNGRLTEDIRQGKYPVSEGAVIKGVVKDQVHIIKVKTNAYMKKLKAAFEDTWEDYWE